jgi:hypothetical protein
MESAGGCSIQPLICSHQTSVPDNYFLSERIIHNPFTRNKDLDILTKCEEEGHKWKTIGASLGRDKIEVKHRHNYLIRRELLKHPFDEVEVYRISLRLN